MISMGQGNPIVSYCDQVIYHLVLAILWELSARLPFIPSDDFDPCGSIHDDGPHRIYYFHITARDDLDGEELKRLFIAALEHYCKISIVKPLFFAIDTIPHGKETNFYSSYLSVVI